MSESEAKPAKKKGGKLPIILALVLMLAGGGFFMMKGGKKTKKKPVITLSKEEIVLPDEFVVNLADGRTFLRVKVGLRTKEGVKAEDVTKHDAEISDAINVVFKSTKPDETITEKHLKKIKWQIAEKINKILEVKEEEAEEETKSRKDSKKKSSHDKEKKEEEEVEIPEGGEDWDSYSGPVLKIFFKTFATQ
jgi:flagellar basal body-associated protein FliL